MAGIGLSTYLHAKLDELTGTYDTPSKMAGAIDFKEALDRSDTKLYSDNELTDSDTSVTGGKITLTIDDDDDTIFAPILGETVEKSNVGGAERDVVISKTDDDPTPQGFGYITKKNGGKYRATFYPRVKFTRGDEEAKTAEDKTEYTKPTMEGTLYPVNGIYKKKVTVDSLEDAKKALYGFFGVVMPADSAAPSGSTGVSGN